MDEVALFRDTISHYALVLPHLCQSQSRRTGSFFVARIEGQGANDAQVEYALAPQIGALGISPILGDYGITDFTQASGVRIPGGVHDLPIVSVGGVDEFTRHLDRFDEDMWNLTGTNRGWPVAFEIGMQN